MDKIKINLASGTSLEKPLVSAFKSNNAIYVVFDNEINGTMGLITSVALWHFFLY